MGYLLHILAGSNDLHVFSFFLPLAATPAAAAIDGSLPTSIPGEYLYASMYVSIYAECFGYTKVMQCSPDR